MPVRLSKHYAARLLNEAERYPERLAERKKFWRADFFPHYLRRAEKLIWEDPLRALQFLKPAPALATQVAKRHPTANGADLMILAHSYLGNAYRKLASYEEAKEQFEKAASYRSSASPEALATYLQLYTSLCIALRRPETFDLINEAIAIRKSGNLVHRHYLGECLVLRGIAYFKFDQPDRILGELSAALNHLSISEHPIPYHCALHNLAFYAVRYGSDDDVRQALANLQPARVTLRGYSEHEHGI